MNLEGIASDPELLGENAIMFRLLDESGAEVLGPTPFVGRISSLYKHGLQYRWEIPGPGGRSKLSTENFDELIHPGRALKVKFRQPLLAKTKFYEAGCTVMKVNKEIDDGVTEATIHLEYTDIDSKDREALDQFVEDQDYFRGEMKSSAK